MMQEAAIVLAGLVIVAAVNFLGFRQLNKTLRESRK